MYNGYKNQATWLAALWLTNDESLFNEAREAAFASPDCLAEAVKEAVEGLVLPEDSGTFAADLILLALEDVDWEEVAEEILPDGVTGRADDFEEVNQ